MLVLGIHGSVVPLVRLTGGDTVVLVVELWSEDSADRSQRGCLILWLVVYEVLLVMNVSVGKEVCI
jgi:hypothetical protein